jgi:hypothetical protein
MQHVSIKEKNEIGKSLKKDYSKDNIIALSVQYGVSADRMTKWYNNTYVGMEMQTRKATHSDVHQKKMADDVHAQLVKYLDEKHQAGEKRHREAARSPLSFSKEGFTTVDSATAIFMEHKNPMIQLDNGQVIVFNNKDSYEKSNARMAPSAAAATAGAATAGGAVADGAILALDFS